MGGDNNDDNNDDKQLNIWKDVFMIVSNTYIAYLSSDIDSQVLLVRGV